MGRAHRSAWGCLALAVPARRNIEFAERSAFTRKLAGRLEVESGAENTFGSGEHRHARVVVVLESQEGIVERIGRGRIDRIARLRPVDGDGGDRVGLVDTNRHVFPPEQFGYVEKSNA